MDIRIGGIVFSDWKIVRQIGQGASGTVYEIRKENQGASLSAALKVLQIQREPGDGSGEAADRLHKLVDELIGEIKIMISLKEFAYVVKCEDFAVESSPAGDQWTIAIRMEMLESIAGYRCGHEMTEADIHRLALHITKALALLEERGIIHRDIKPENIFVSPFGDFKLGDFGIARVCGQTMASRSQVGTQGYMAPEVFHCQEFDHTADIYSLGLVLYRYLNRDRLPFLPLEGEISPIDRQSALAERLSGKKEISAPACASEAFGRIILKMCAYRPEDRYANAALLLRDLEAIRPTGTVVLPAGGPGAEMPAPQEAEEGLTGGQASSLRGHVGKAGAVGGATVHVPAGDAAGPAPAAPGADGAHDRAEKGQDKGAGGTPAAHTRKERGYKPPVGADAGSGGNKKKSAGKKKLLLAVALAAVVLAAAIPAIRSREFALVVKDGSGSGSFKAGQVVTAEAETAENAAFAGWVVEEGGLPLSEEELAGAELSFRMPSHDVTVRAEYVLKEHETEIRNGSGSGTYAVGDVVEVTADAPEEGMEFSRWKSLKGRPDLEDSSLAETSFIMPDQDVVIEAQYEPLTYELTVDEAGGSGEYAFGETVRLTAEEKQTYTFKGWEVVKGPLALDDKSKAEQKLEFTMPADDVAIAAVYEKNSHTVTVGSGSGSGTYEVGQTVEITADPAGAGMQFSGWQVLKGRASIENAALESTAFVMPDQDVTVACKYAPIEYQLTVNGGSGGGSYHMGDQVTISADAVKDGMTFSGWTVDVGSLTFSDLSAQNLTFTMPAEQLIISAHYMVSKRVLTVKNGTGSGMFTVGDEVTATAEALGPNGETFAYWTVDAGDLDTSGLDMTQTTLRFAMPDSAVTLTALYALPQKNSNMYVLSVNGGSGSGEYAAGTTVTVQAQEPSAGMKFVSWLVNGYPGELDVKSATLEITMPDHDVTLTAFFSN